MHTRGMTQYSFSLYSVRARLEDDQASLYCVCACLEGVSRLIDEHVCQDKEYAHAYVICDITAFYFAVCMCEQVEHQDMENAGIRQEKEDADAYKMLFPELMAMRTAIDVATATRELKIDRWGKKLDEQVCFNLQNCIRLC